MGIRARNLHPSSSIYSRAAYFPFSQPAFDIDRVVTAANGDLSAAAAGDPFTLTSSYVQPNTLLFTQTDFAGGDLDVTYLITGRNQHGEAITESVAIGPGVGAAVTSAAWLVIDSIVITEITDNGASDTIQVGVGDDASGRIGYGIPMKNPISTDILAVINVATYGAIAGTIDSENAVYRRTTAVDASATDFIMILDRDSPRL